jgi:hypothetical protein
MTGFELGQVFQGRIAGEQLTLVVINTNGEHATLAVAPDRDRQMMLAYEDLTDWNKIPASHSDWYLEAVMPSGDLFWSVFIPGFEAAWAFYTAQHPDVAEAGGYIRVGDAADATDNQRMAFRDAARAKATGAR